MRIALYHNLPSGGALAHFTQVAEAMARAGHRLHLFCPSTAEATFGDLHDIVHESTIFPRAPWLSHHPLLNPILYRRYLESTIAQESQWAQHIADMGFDGIYLGQCQTWTEPPLLRFLPKSLPKVLYCQEPKRSFHEERFLKEQRSWPWYKKCWRLPTIHWMKRNMDLNIRRADLVLCNSHFSKTRINQAYPELDPVVSYIGVDVAAFKPPHHPPPPKYLITVGALDPSKNHAFAIDVAAQRPSNIDFEVHIVTDRSHGTTADDLQQQAREAHVSLHIHTRVDRDRLVELYGQSFACVYFPKEEPFGMVSIESQACGTPVLGIDEGGIRETLLDGVGGYRFTPEPVNVADQLAKWVQDSNAYAHIRAQARQHAQSHWKKSTLVEGTLQQILSCFQAHGKGPHHQVPKGLREFIKPAQRDKLLLPPLLKQSGF